jgi:hypothetical protein
MARDQVSALQERKLPLTLWIDEQKNRVQTMARMPGLIKTFLEDFQTILKAAHTSRYTIEFDFRV